MKLATVMLSSVFLASQAVATDLRYDSNFDYVKNLPLTSFACSDGANGLITKTGAQTLGQLKSKLRPNTYVAAGGISGWNSPNCGQCWKGRAPNGASLQFVLIDKATPSVVMGEEAFKILSPSKTLQEGHITIYVTQLPRASCYK
jgi:hypothetical protein